MRLVTSLVGVTNVDAIFCANFLFTSSSLILTLYDFVGFTIGIRLLRGEVIGNLILPVVLILGVERWDENWNVGCEENWPSGVIGAPIDSSRI